MNEILHSLSFLSAGAANALVSAIWEGAVLALGVYLGLRLLPGLSAAARSLVWLNVFVLLVLLHLVPALGGRAAELPVGQLPAIHLDLRWSLGVVAVWLALTLWRATQLIFGIVQLRRLAGRAKPIEVAPHLKALLADALGGRPAELCTSNEVIRPSVLGFLRPRILVPAALVDYLTPQELEQVVLHEREHLRRGDDWTNLVQKVGLVLFPLNPVLVWVERRLCAERELACDDRVMESSAGRKAYALCLARLAELSLFRNSFSLVLGLWERRPELVRRVQRIVSQPVRSMGRRPAMAATGGVLAGALGCALALSHSPQLVSFAPEQRPLLSSLDPRELGRTLGGTPQMMKASMPPGLNDPGSALLDSTNPRSQKRDLRHPVSSRQPLRRTLLNGARHRPAPSSRMASLNFPGLKSETWGTRLSAGLSSDELPNLDERTLVLLTEVRTFQTPPRVVLAVSPDGRTATPAIVHATYAIVPTPSGWLIIQI